MLILNTHRTFVYKNVLLWDICHLKDQLDAEEFDLEILMLHRKQHLNDYLTTEYLKYLESHIKCVTYFLNSIL